MPNSWDSSSLRFFNSFFYGGFLVLWENLKWVGLNFVFYFYCIFMIKVFFYLFRGFIRCPPLPFPVCIYEWQNIVVITSWKSSTNLSLTPFQRISIEESYPGLCTLLTETVDIRSDGQTVIKDISKLSDFNRIVEKYSKENLAFVTVTVKMWKKIISLFVIF